MTSKGLRYAQIKVEVSHPLVAFGGAYRLSADRSTCYLIAHRVLLYERIGPGPHPCHWCGRLVDWAADLEHDVVRLVVDHLDNDGRNNGEDNLVASCHPCNCRRDSGAPAIGPTVGHGKAGEYNGRARLSASDVMEMRRLYACGEYSQAELGRRFGIKRAQASKILRGHSWQEQRA